MEAAQSALDRIDEIEDEERADEAQLKRLRDLYRGPLPDVPGGARRRGPRDAPRASSGSPTTASCAAS